MVAVPPLTELTSLAHVILPSDAGKTPVSVGWTPTATIGLLQTATLWLLGGGGLRLLANHLLSLRKIAEARSARIDQRSDDYASRLGARVTELESELLSIRADHTREMAEERRSCDEKLESMRREVNEIQKRMDGLMRGIVQMQASEARAIPLSPEMQRALESLDKLKGVNE